MAMRATLLLIAPLCAACAAPPAGPGELLLSNPHFGQIHVEAVITANPDCGSRGPGYVATQRFLLPADGTRFIAVPPGAEICWRRDREPDHPVAEAWSPWDRAYVAPGETVDANL